jgi:TRAP-type C4-dicarboxylate transport system permease small subunit
MQDEITAAGPLRRLLFAVCRVAESAAVLMLFAVTTLVMIQVFARELFNDGAPWADELARFCGLGLIFLAVPLLLLKDGHVRVDMFLNLLPRAPRRVADVLNECLTVLFCVLYLASGWFFMQRAGRFSSPALSIPNLVYYMPAAIGMALTLLAAIDRVLAALRGDLRRSADAGGHGA